MTVDSEIIFALAERAERQAAALEKLRGVMATAWLDERRPGVCFVARGIGRPLWVGKGARETFFASTEFALEVVERYLNLRLQKREVPEGTLLGLADGRTAWMESFRPDRTYREDAPLPAVRAPHEAESCLERLAVLAAT